MKNRIYQQIFTVLILSGISFLTLVSCNKKHNQKEPIVVNQEFASQNWTFDNQVMFFDFDITDTSKAYRIEFLLTYDSSMVELEEIPVVATLIYPDGMETVSSSNFLFDPKVNKNITPTDVPNVCNTSLVIFPKKNLNQSGAYKIRLYRKTPKYDNYGFNAISLKVSPLKK